MTDFSEIVCDELGIPRTSSASELIDFLKGVAIDYLDGLISSDDGKDAALAMLVRLANYEISVVEQAGDLQEKFCAVEIVGEQNPALVGLFSECNAPSYATDLESLIFCAIARPNTLPSLGWSESPSCRKLNWRDSLRGRAIIALPLPVNPRITSSISAVFCLQHANLSLIRTSSSIAPSASVIQIDQSPTLLSDIQCKLLFEAASTNHPKWRFLSFYRVLENAYLTSIKKSLLVDFDNDAGKAVKKAQEKLQSEANQLVSLMSEANLQDEFQIFNNEFEALMAAGNRYLNAIDRNAQDESLYRAGAAQKAVIRFYKVRCSIAHAGTSSVFFEQISDAPSAVCALLTSVEAIALKSLSISTR